MNPKFEEMKVRWRELMRAGNNKEADKLYWKKMFPEIERKFVEEAQKMIKNGEIPRYDLLVVPLSLQSSYFILLINGLKPKEVYFICTREGEKHSLGRVVEMTGLTQDRYKKDVIEYAAMDIADVYEKIKRRIKIFKGRKIAVDLSRGKRIMAAGAAIVGDFFGCDLIYIDDNWYDDIRKGEPGTEKLIKVKNPLHIFGDLQQMYAIELFNNHRHFSSNMLFRDIINKAPDPREFEIKSLICECYMFWDSFNYKAALPILERVINKIKQYNVKTLDIEQLKKNLVAMRQLNKIQTSDKKLVEMLKNDDVVAHLLVDILCNAKRRAEQKKYEDAISRLYRAIELVSQNRLSKLGIDTVSPIYGKIDPEKFKRIAREVYNVEKELPGIISLMDGHIILFAIDDDIWKNRDIEDLKKLHKAIKLRDYSLVAHGTQVVNKNVYEKLERLTKELLENLCTNYKKDFNSLTENHKFLKL